MELVAVMLAVAVVIGILPAIDLKEREDRWSDVSVD